MDSNGNGFVVTMAQVGFNVRYWLHCQSFFFLLRVSLVQQGIDYHLVYSNFFLKVLDQWCHKFSEGYLSNFSTELSSQIFYFCHRNFLIQEERIGNVVSTSHWITPVYVLLEQLFLNGAEFSLNSGNLIKHWRINLTQFKDSLCYLCHAGAVVASSSLTLEVTGSSPFTVIKIFLSLKLLKAFIKPP